MKRLVVVAATNRPDVIDPALLRPGRLDRLVYVPPPDELSRRDILRLSLAKVPCAGDVEVEALARRTEGFSGAEVGWVAMSLFLPGYVLVLWIALIGVCVFTTETALCLTCVLLWAFYALQKTGDRFLPDCWLLLFFFCTFGFRAHRASSI